MEREKKYAEINLSKDEVKDVKSGVAADRKLDTQYVDKMQVRVKKMKKNERVKRLRNGHENQDKKENMDFAQRKQLYMELIENPGGSSRTRDLQSNLSPAQRMMLDETKSFPGKLKDTGFVKAMEKEEVAAGMAGDAEYYAIKVQKENAERAEKRRKEEENRENARKYAKMGRDTVNDLARSTSEFIDRMKNGFDVGGCDMKSVTEEITKMTKNKDVGIER